MWPLNVVGILYLLSGVWCTFRYQLAAGYVGYELQGNKGAVEFLSVYGGIQLGLALAVLYFSFKKEHVRVATQFTMFISVGLLLFRGGSMSLLGSDPALWVMASVELFIVLLLAYQLFSTRPHAK